MENQISDEDAAFLSNGGSLTELIDRDIALEIKKLAKEIVQEFEDKIGYAPAQS